MRSFVCKIGEVFKRVLLTFEMRDLFKCSTVFFFKINEGNRTRMN